MTKKIYSGILVVFLLITGSLHAATYTSVANGNWNAAGTWGGTVPLATDNAIIAAGTTVTLTAAAGITNVTVNGQLTANFALTVNAAGVFTINANGTYLHNTTTVASTTIFNGTEAFNSASTVQINNWSALATNLITGETSNFGHLILNWNTGVSLWNNNGLGWTRTIQGNLTVQNTCGTYFSNAAGAITINIGGNFSVLTNGYVEAKRNSTGNLTFNVAGSTTISGASSAFYGLMGNNASATGTLTYTTTNYTQSGGFFNGTTYAGMFGTAGGGVTFTASGAFTISGGQHIGVRYPFAGNFGIATYSLQSFSLTGGSIILHSSVITDGRTITLNVTNDFTCAFSAAANFAEMSNLTGGGQNQLYIFTVGGNFSVSGPAGALFKIKQDGTGADNVVITNDCTVSGAFAGFSDMNTSTLTMTIGRNITFTGGTTTFSNQAASRLDLVLGTAAVNWNQTVATVSLCNTNIKSGKTVTLTGTLMGAIIAARIITVETGSRLYCANATVTGAGLFTLQSGTTLGIGSIAGITSAGATGNIQVSGARTYNSVATYEYYQGLTPQITGNFVTTTTSGTYPCQISNLVINKTLSTNIVNLTNTTDITGGGGGTLTLTNGILTTSFTAATAPWIRIAIGSLASPVGGSANSYVNGYIRKQGSTSFIFPTGNNGRWRRIEMTAPSISTEFEARYVNAAYANTASMAAVPTNVLDHVSTIEHWFLNKPLGADAATAKVKLYWEDASTSGILKFDSLAVGRWNGAAWEDANCYSSCPANWTTSQPERTYTGSATGAGAGTIQSNTVSSFSPFTFASIGAYALNPLPVEFVSFTGHYDGFADVLNWTTASETNNNYFTVERTFDGINFEDVKRVPGAGNSTQLINYSTSDNKQYSGTAYYRLKQTDFNGQFDYSGLIAITHENQEHVSIFPNPVSGTDVTLNFECTSDELCQVTILDITGKIISSKAYQGSEGSNSLHLNVADLSAGIYFITIHHHDQLNKIKFIKE